MELHQIAFFGATNSGKSTLVNRLAGQAVSLVSAVPGTTTDPVRKRLELPGLGPCVLVDTAGYGDSGELGAQRERLTRAVLDSTDVAVLLISGHPADAKWESQLRKAGVPVVLAERAVPVEELLRRIREALPQEEHKYLTGRLVKAGDTVLLVMPQDSEAPKGRLILPQVQVIRELLDRGCTPLCCTPASLPAALASLRSLPALTITDASVFRTVNELLPPEASLTAFSVLLAAAKGDMQVFVEGARAIDRLTARSRVLIAEACTHVPDTEDIGRVKIPALLRRVAAGGDSGREHFVSERTEMPEQRSEEMLTIDIAAGNDFPEDLTGYDLIIHCGACMATRTRVMARTRKALLSGVPITNYGIALAKLQGMLERVVIPGSRTRKQSS